MLYRLFIGVVIRNIIDVTVTSLLFSWYPILVVSMTNATINDAGVAAEFTKRYNQLL